jgi:hypothetical protein
MSLKNILTPENFRRRSSTGKGSKTRDPNSEGSPEFKDPVCSLIYIQSNLQSEHYVISLRRFTNWVLLLVMIDYILNVSVQTCLSFPSLPEVGIVFDHEPESVVLFLIQQESNE